LLNLLIHLLAVFDKEAGISRNRLVLQMAIERLNGFARAALVVAHPSHELRVHGWLQMARPRVFIITDGSGREGQPRLPSTTKVLEDAGASQGSIYGRFTDLEIYTAFLNRDFDLFIRLAEELAEEFRRHEIEYVVGDSAEGYNTTHDACRLVTDAAVDIVRRKDQRQIANFEFLVVGPPDECPATIRNAAIWLSLDDEAFSRKVTAARGYNSKLALDIDSALRGQPFRGVQRFSAPQLAGDVDKSLSKEVEVGLRSDPKLEARFKSIFDGIELDRFRGECLRPVVTPDGQKYGGQEAPFYELYGEKMVAAGHYKTVIRYAEHFLPLAEAVWRHVATY
jgi:hypothetical protein